MQASARAGRLEEELVSLKKKEQGARDRADAAEHQLADARAEAKAAEHAAQRAQREATESAEALHAEAVAAREQVEDLRDRAEALESQLQEKASAASRTRRLLSYQVLHDHLVTAMAHGAEGRLSVLCEPHTPRIPAKPYTGGAPFCEPATKHTWQAC